MNVGANSDIHPSKWHPSWHRYAEYGGWAAILHDSEMAGHLNLCVVPASTPPTGDHRGCGRVHADVYFDLSSFDTRAREVLDHVIELFGERP